MEQPPYIHYINTFLSSEPHRGLGVMPKRGCDVGACEIFRLYKLHGNGKIEPIRFYVPRKSDQFQEDLYPDSAADTPAISADEWWLEKKDANPVLVSLKGGYHAKSAQTLTVAKKTNVLDKINQKGKDLADSGMDELRAELKKMRRLIVDHEMRIKELEAKLGIVHSNGDDHQKSEGQKDNGAH